MVFRGSFEGNGEPGADEPPGEAMKIPDRIRTKLDTLPDAPGVYIMRDRSGRVIYVGKAASLRRRVSSYFRAGTHRRADPKLRGLVHSIADFETIGARDEAEAILLEGRLIKDYRPRFNVEFRDDKRFLLLRANRAAPLPRFDACRLQKDDGADYFGPYASSASARAALDFLDRRFGLRRCRPARPGPEDHRHCHNDILRFCSAPCMGAISEAAYRARVDEACAFLRGERMDVLRELRAEMEREAAALHFEKAAALRDSLRLLEAAVRQRVRVEPPAALRAEDARAGLRALQETLALPAPPRVIEAYDISHISGTLAVGSLVCAVDGLPDRRRYRRFRIRAVNRSDDPAMMEEMLRRRFMRAEADDWRPPDLVLVDGGLTQLRAARRALCETGLGALPAIGLAKRFEEVYAGPDGAERIVRLPEDSPALKVLTRLRDEAHRFALAYHLKLRARRIRESALDDIEGIGPKRKEQLLRHFGSVQRLRRASAEEIAAVPGVGSALAAQIHAALGGGAAAVGDVAAGKDAVPEKKGRPLAGE